MHVTAGAVKVINYLYLSARHDGRVSAGESAIESPTLLPSETPCRHSAQPARVHDPAPARARKRRWENSDGLADRECEDPEYSYCSFRAMRAQTKATVKDCARPLDPFQNLVLCHVSTYLAHSLCPCVRPISVTPVSTAPS